MAFLYCFYLNQKKSSSGKNKATINWIRQKKSAIFSPPKKKLSNVLNTDNEIISFDKLVKSRSYKSHKTAEEDDEYYVAETDPDAISYEEEEDFADVNPVHLPIVKKIPLEKVTPQESKPRADRNFKEKTTTESGDYDPDYDDYNDEGTVYYNDEETSKGLDGNNSYNFYQFSKTNNFVISDQNIGLFVLGRRENDFQK